ncbi:MAG: hypothetical protein HY554_15350 [Elusimicrobia bacterium]|nr:hypothetical protein [Elusimicrobiota bacterium]
MIENFWEWWRAGRAARGAAGLVVILWAAPLRAHEGSAPPPGPAPVGLAAAGVDVRAAFRGDLDVRDAFNRPVRRDLVERDLRGAASAADPSAELSRLPMAKALWQALDRVLTGLGLRSPGAGRPQEAHAASGWLSRFEPRLLPALCLLFFFAAASGLAGVAAATAPASTPRRIRILRC